jgi:flagellum-specific peptidoglycan hydrolase FlgJ
MLFIVVAGSFISGLIDTINHDDENPNKDLKLIFGCVELFLAMLIAFYKQSKIAENQQDHYHLSNNYKILLNKINTDLLLINTNRSIYITNIECIKDITEQFNNLIINAPIIPYYILKKYHIKDNVLGNNRIEDTSYNVNQPLQNTQSVNVKILEPIFENNLDDNNLQDIPLGNLKNQIEQLKTSPKSRKCSLNKSYSIRDLNSMKKDDIDNYESFINKINIKDEDKYTNSIITNFKKVFDD